jgi:invasion protein IalB
MVNCTNVAGGFDCRASQTLFLRDRKIRLLTLAVRKAPGDKRPVMLIQGPLGFYLPGGITLQVGKEAAKALAVQTCDQVGCVAEYAISDAEIEAIRDGADLTVTMQDLKKTPVPLKVPTIGFAEAYAKLQ